MVLERRSFIFSCKHPCHSKCCSGPAYILCSCLDSGCIFIIIQAGFLHVLLKTMHTKFRTILLFLSRTAKVKAFRLGLWHFRVNVAWLGATGEGGKPIIKIRKLNLRRLRRRENAVQRTPPRAHQPWPDYGIYNVLNWNAEEGTSSAFQCTTY